MKTKKFVAKKGVNDLTKNPEAGALTFVFGQYTLGLKNFQNVHGHDDSIPFYAEIWAKDGDKDSVKIAFAENDGWGGPTNVTPFYGNKALYDAVTEAIKEYEWCSDGIKYGPFDLEFVSEIIACTYSN